MNETVTSLTDGETVLARVEIAAPPEQVFRALTTREVEQWWGAPGVCRVEGWRAQVIPGGTWTIGVCLPDGRLLPACGVFLEVEPPVRLVHTRVYLFEHPTLGRRETLVTFRFLPTGHGTRLTVRQDGFAGLTAAAEEHRLGCERLLSWLAGYLRGRMTAPREALRSDPLAQSGARTGANQAALASSRGIRPDLATDIHNCLPNLATGQMFGPDPQNWCQTMANTQKASAIVKK